MPTSPTHFYRFSPQKRIYTNHASQNRRREQFVTNPPWRVRSGESRWKPHLDRARETLAPGESLTVRKSEVGEAEPAAFYPSPLSMPGDARAVYRERRWEHTLQIREYDRKFRVQMDRYHPARHPLGHLRHDVTATGLRRITKTVGVGLVAVSLLCGPSEWRE
ncbi:MAG: hypothetical protein ABEI99_06905 [Halobaculum sp.]